VLTRREVLKHALFFAAGGIDDRERAARVDLLRGVSRWT
jgi:hypothetical protein